jgi:hypothetical protein
MRFGSGIRDKAEGDFLVGSRITAVSKLVNAYEALGGFDPS